MGYYDDYNNDRHKIPYDDYPVTRNERTASGGGRNRSGGFKAPPLLMSILLVANMLLSVISFVMVKTTKYRTINNYILELGDNSEVSIDIAIKNSAISSSVCVTALGTSGTSTGAGVIYKIERKSDDETSSDYNKGTIYFVTCYHVVEDIDNDKLANIIKVQLSTSTDLIDVKAVGYSSKYDLAVLKYTTNNIETTLWGSTQTTIFDSAYVSQGEHIFAVGNPLGLGTTITDGLISQLNTLVVVEGIRFRCLQISAEINPGNSGGGLFNARGELVGIVNAKRDTASTGSGSISVEGTSYAIPSSVVRGVAEQLISGNTKVLKPKVSVSFDNSAQKSIEPIIYNNETRFIDNYSVYVSSVDNGINYETTEEFIIGDVITHFTYVDILTGKEVTRTMYNKYSFEDYVLSIKPYSTIKFYVEGQDSPIEIKANSFDVV